MSAFEMALERGSEGQKKMLWKHLQPEKEHFDVFIGLCQKGKIDAMTWCLDNMASQQMKQGMLEFRENKLNMFPLLYALDEGQEDASALLVQEHKKVNKKFLLNCDLTKRNALINASIFGFDGIVKEIIDIYQENDMIGEVDVLGYNALMWASQQGHLKVVEILLDHFVNEGKLEQKANDGNTALDLAEQFEQQAGIELREKVAPKEANT